MMDAMMGKMKGSAVAALSVVVCGGLGIGAGCVSPVIPIGSGKSRTQVEHENLSRLLPAQLTASGTWKGKVRVARLRVWADDEYRAQNVRWQHGFDEQLDYANQVLAPMLGVRLEAEYHPWEHHAPGSALSDHLESLAGVDSGDDVVWTVGLTSSLSLAASSFEQIGVAALGDRHVMMRGHADLEERKAFARAFPDIDLERRELVLEARRKHKTTALLLHELAHSLGALHEVEVDGLMSPAYSHHAASIGGRNRELMQIMLDDRLKPPSQRDPEGTIRKLLAALDPAWAGWNEADRTRWIANLRAAGPASGPDASGRGAGPGTAHGVGSAAAAPVKIPVEAMQKYRDAEKLLSDNNYDDAASEAAQLVAAYPSHVTFHVLACRIELKRDPHDARATTACDRAASLATDLRPAIEIAEARQNAGDAAGARATLTSAEARLARMTPAQATAAWLRLADHYRNMEALTWAENAVVRSGVDPATNAIAAWATTTRIRFGIPRDGARWKLAPEDEFAALTAVRDVIVKSDNNKFDAAARALAEAEKRWPGLPGLLAARCDLELSRGAVAAAQKTCARALTEGPSSWALYISGVVELRIGTPSTAIARLRKAIEVDPELVQAWHTLAKAYRRANAVTDLDELHRGYRARFGTQTPL